MTRPFWLAVFAGFAVAGSAGADEPNDSYATATLLSPGQLSVSDDLTIKFASYPDTVLGVANQFGIIYETNDDDSPLGDGHASGLGGVPTNSGSIDFYVSGYPDDFFEGSHNEAGDYEVFVDVYDFFSDLVDSFNETRTLAPGVVHSFSYSDFEWIEGNYDVYIDNTVGPPTSWDVDFFRFTGLTSGAQFAAGTLGTGIDTFLGWYSSEGALLETDDNGGGGVLSRIEGTVPADGTLTFAVTGYGDDDFVGAHNEQGDYQLVLELNSISLAGDYNGDHVVNAADYTVWRNLLGSNTPLTNETESLGVVDEADYAAWKTNFGATDGGGAGSGGGSTGAVPEPASFVLLLVAGACTATRIRDCKLAGK
jgi:hypothetical protein